MKQVGRDHMHRATLDIVFSVTNSFYLAQYHFIF